MNLLDIRKVEVKGKRVFVRADLDAPISSSKFPTSLKLRGASKVPASTAKRGEQSSKLACGEIVDDSRLIAGIPTIQYLLCHGATVIVGGHLGRPNARNQELGIPTSPRLRGASRNQEFSLEPVAKWFATKCKVQSAKCKIEETKLGEFEGWNISENLYLLENLRFYEGEESNDPQFAKKLASLADIYVNDAFATTHRNHASVVGIINYLPHFAGLNLQKEVDSLSQVLENPNRPLVVIIGGEKIETKLPLAYKMLQLANYVLVGGKIAQEESTLLQVQQQQASKSVLMIAQASADKTDISEKSIKDFLGVIKLAKTIVWNGPMGKISSKCKVQSAKLDWEMERGTREIAKGVAESPAYKVVGGGDTIEFLKRNNLIDKFDFVSTGGGAMLSFLSGEKMPGIEVLVEHKEPSSSFPTLSR